MPVNNTVFVSHVDKDIHTDIDVNIQADINVHIDIKTDKAMHRMTHI